MDQQRLSDQTLFKPVDAVRMAKQMSLSEIGIERGKQNLPPPTTALPDEIEQSIIEQVSAHHSSVVNDVQLRLQAVNSGISRNLGSIGTSVLETDVDPLVSRIEQYANTDIIDLHDTRTKLKEQREYFRSWRTRRNLARPAREPKPAFSFFADLFVLAIAEGGLNLFFFMEGNEFGILGAFLQAFLIAGANIVVCTVVGFVLLKRVNSVFILNKALGFLSIIFLVIGLPIVHGIVGFYRIARKEAASIAPLDGAPDVVAEGAAEIVTSQLWTAISWATNFEFHRLDEMSIIMCVIGTILGAYAARKGYEFGDRYPDYTKNYFDYEDRRVYYLDHLQEITDEILTEQEEASGKIGTFLVALSASLTSLSDFRNRKTELSVSLRGFESHLTEVGKALLSEYRGANESVRTVPAPNTFQKQFALPDPVFDGDSVRNSGLASQILKHEGIDAQVNRTAEAAKKAAEKYRERVQVAIERAQSELHAGEELKGSIEDYE